MGSASACLLLVIHAASASQWNYETFRYTKSPAFRRILNENCMICYGNQDCITLDTARCDYYSETADILADDDDQGEANPDLRMAVDSMLYELVDEVSANPKYEDCIPFISTYTDCTKENICIGCNSCSCDAEGMWNCSSVQRCRPEAVKLTVDHRMLIIVMEALRNNDNYSSRTKRSNTNDQNTESNKTTIEYEELSEWLYGVNPLNADLNNQTKDQSDREGIIISTEKLTSSYYKNESENQNSETNTEMTQITKPVSHNIIEAMFKSDSENLAFDDVLNSIIEENNNYTRRKPALDTDFNNNSINNSYNQFMQVLNDMEEEEVTESTLEGVTKIVIDLLESVKNNEGENFTNTDIKDYQMNYAVDKNYEDIHNELSNSNYIHEKYEDDIGEFNSIDIMKRELRINNATERNNESNVTYIHDNNTVNIDNNIIKKLTDDILVPLCNIIGDKQKEIEALLDIKEKLINFMKSYREDNSLFNFRNTSNCVIKYNMALNNSLHKLQIIPQIEYDLRRTNINIFEKVLYKLKRDIYELIKDIMAILKFKHSRKLPRDLKVLIRAMKYYVYSKNKNYNNNNKINLELHNRNLRRHLDIPEKPKSNTVEYMLVKILKKIDTESSQSFNLNSLSLKANKILKRVIRQNYVDSFVVFGLRVYDPHYNLTNELSNIGLKWQKMTEDVIDSSPFDQMYKMKSLHLVLSVDMNKMIDALTLIDYAHSRRMILVDQDIGEKILVHLNNELKTIHNKIEQIVRQKKDNEKLNNLTFKSDSFKKITNKESFSKRIKNLLKKLMSRLQPDKVSKPKTKYNKYDLVKKTLSEHEQTMQKWQNNLNMVPPRNKRSVKELKKYRNRIKNILPKYLRGKLNPAISAKNPKKNKFVKTNKTNEIGKPKIKNIKLTSTTARIKSST